MGLVRRQSIFVGPIKISNIKSEESTDLLLSRENACNFVIRHILFWGVPNVLCSKIISEMLELINLFH